MEFREKITAFLESTGWSESELARRCNVSPSTANNWTNGKRRPYDPAVVRLARVMGVSVDFLADDDADDSSAATLGADDRAILTVIHALGLTPSEAIRRVAKDGPMPERGSPVDAGGQPVLPPAVAVDPYAEVDRRGVPNGGGKR